MPKKKPAPAQKPAAYPSAKAGNYRAPVDTVGMDPDMIVSLGIKRQKKPTRTPR